MLTVELTVNGRPIGDVLQILNLGPSTTTDGTPLGSDWFEYEVTLGDAQVHVDHKRDDGAWMLVNKALRQLGEQRRLPVGPQR